MLLYSGYRITKFQRDSTGMSYEGHTQVNTGHYIALLKLAFSQGLKIHFLLSKALNLKPI